MQNDLNDSLLIISMCYVIALLLMPILYHTSAVTWHAKTENMPYQSNVKLKTKAAFTIEASQLRRLGLEITSGGEANYYHQATSNPGAGEPKSHLVDGIEGIVLQNA